jgi:hypothetical protein
MPPPFFVLFLWRKQSGIDLKHFPKDHRLRMEKFTFECMIKKNRRKG